MSDQLVAYGFGLGEHEVWQLRAEANLGLRLVTLERRYLVVDF